MRATVPDKLLTARQVAERLQVSIGWVQAHATGKHRPVLPSLKLGRTLRFREDEVEAFLKRCQRQMEMGLPLQ
jgi:excisionase family DNA binding protein